ncbi:unnamed protein product [Brassica oleracea var. botrytis]|nr:uncharacterized protein LOC125583844 [Brassica napus]
MDPKGALPDSTGDEELTMEEKAKTASKNAKARALNLKNKAGDEELTMEEKLCVVQEEKAKNAAKTAAKNAKARALKLKKKADDQAELKPAAANASPPLVAAHPAVGSDSDDEPPREISNEEATSKELYLQYLESSTIHVNPFPLIRSLETFDDWNDEDCKRYFDHLFYEKGHRYMKQYELDFIQTYSTHNPQGRHSRFDE